MTSERFVGIRLEQRHVDRIRSLCASMKDANKVVMRAINKAGKKGQTTAINEVRKDISLTKYAAQRSIRWIPATPSRLAGQIEVVKFDRNGHSMAPLIEYGARQIQGGFSKQGRRGTTKAMRDNSKWKKATNRQNTVVTVRPYNAGRNEEWRHAFIAQFKSGHVGVFIRDRNSRRFPISELIGPSVMRVLADRPGVLQRVRAQIAGDLLRQLNSSLRGVLKLNKADTGDLLT